VCVDSQTQQQQSDAVAKKSTINGDHAGRAPEIYMWTDGRFELADVNAQLFCRAAGNPPPSVYWLNEDGERVKNGERYEQLSNGDLLIRPTRVDERDENTGSATGVYTCVAHNEHGLDKIDAFFYATAVRFIHIQQCFSNCI
jgi:hypothetical protein